MIRTFERRGVVVGVVNGLILLTIPVERLSAIRVIINVTAVTGAPSGTFRLMNVDNEQFVGQADVANVGGIKTAVRAGSGSALAVAAAVQVTGVATVSVQDFFSGYPADCKEVVAVVADNAAASTDLTVDVFVTVADGL